MEQVNQNSGLRESMQEHSRLSEHDPAEVKAYDLISQALIDVLEPGERVLTYADRDLHSNQIDALAYDTQTAAEQPDVMGYRPGGPAEETDGLTYDKEAGRSAPDVMGYRHGAPSGQTDAVAYEGAPESAENDAFMSGTEVRAADVDFLVLTDSRLIRGFLEDDEVMIAQTPYEEPQVRVVGESYLAVRLSPAVCGLGEGDWWCWRLPDGVDPRSAAKKWGRAPKDHNRPSP